MLSIRINKAYLLFVFVFLARLAQAQQNFDIEQYIQDLIKPYRESDLNIEVYDRLLQFYQHPLNLNKVSRSDLESLFLLEKHQIKAILDYRNEHGEFTSIYELQILPELDIELIRKLKYFLKVYPKNQDFQRFSQRFKKPDSHYLLFRHQRVLERARGYKKENGESHYLGSADKYLIRYRKQRYGDYSLSLNLEKDQGEKLIWAPENHYYGFDFISGHLYKQRIGVLKNVALGDYQMQFGQGLIFSGGFRTGKGTETILSIKQTNTGIRPYGSTLESQFLRGISFGVSKGRFLLSPFFSSKLIDSNIIESDSGQIYFISSFPKSGLHNTRNSMEDRLNNREWIYGGNLLWDDGDKQFGITYAEQNFSMPVNPGRMNKTNGSFSGESERNLSLYYDFSFANINAFGEHAISSKGMASVSGLIASLSRKTSISGLYRNYEASYKGIRASGFSETSGTRNEKGLYFGMTQKIGKTWSLNAFYDIFSHPEPRHLNKTPGRGNEILIRINKRLSKDKSVFLQFRNEVKEQTRTEKNIPRIFERKRQGFILQFDQALNEIISLRTRIQQNISHNRKESRGTALIQDLRLEYRKFRMDLRLSIFDTDDYDSRLYALEKDVLYSLSAPAYFGSGIRNYALFKYKFSRKVNLWLRWARTMKTDVESLGSQQNAIEGNSRNEVKFQLILRL